MSYESDQDKWIREVNLKVGDKVLVVAQVDAYANGWDNTWNSEMLVGVERYLSARAYPYISVAGIELDDGFRYPFFVLVKIN